MTSISEQPLECSVHMLLELERAREIADPRRQ